MMMHKKQVNVGMVPPAANLSCIVKCPVIFQISSFVILTAVTNGSEFKNDFDAKATRAHGPET